VDRAADAEADEEVVDATGAGAEDVEGIAADTGAEDEVGGAGVETGAAVARPAGVTPGPP
jgi:hypothetical protein